MLYLWLKAFHIMSVIAWMAALFYLPRLFVYHAQVAVGSPQSELFKVMERRLLKAIMRPAMMASWIFGLWVAYEGGFLSDGWFHAKLTLVVLMTLYHTYLAKCVGVFAADANQRADRHYRIINEVPTVLMIGVVILVVLKPF
ncbi:protoporphyrinogen oxidase HemJ [Stappia indica]|uniref:protoporphyrinogen oxidase HemJ n=1 Tax=Stappia indica TaxID=538381 RepID=UPI001CD3DE19|nr:protoporphyrinogen oxidase HemJ [Stappia indica]MCA1299688.1 protoporphyrinogen oxidase HemJ [Stappia indica]